MEKINISSSSSPTDNKKKIGSCGQGTKRILKNVVSYLECQSKCPCLQAVKSCSNSSGCIGCENLFSKNQGEDLPVTSSVEQQRRKQFNDRSSYEICTDRA